ncbi:hypothetical protein ABDI30_14650 [Paenibacillus cisolokensis]|uniref:hypothetical protein n=1 Tax=Paenibacillus cisolokensis TaxID=1658519 RepID=UPI003D285EA5
MARSTIMLAVAGSGKTYYIANHLNSGANNLVITYTKQNVANLKREIKKRYGDIPKNTQVLTFTSFLYRWLLKPFEPILTVGDMTGIITYGVEVFKEPEPPSLSGRPNPRYFKKEDYRHYIYNQKYYSARMSELILAQSKDVRKKILERLNRFCDQLYFDELQDFMGKDFDLLTQLVRDPNLSVFAVGDFHQHSVSKSDFKASKPYIKKGKVFLSKDEYKLLFKGKVNIDERTLIKSRRVPEQICTFIRNKLGIHIESSSLVQGHYELLVDEAKILQILSDSTIVKLFYNNSLKYSCTPTINWGYSKGDTYEKCCIVLTKTFESLFEEDFSCAHLSPSQVNPLYVGLAEH